MIIEEIVFQKTNNNPLSLKELQSLLGYFDIKVEISLMPIEQDKLPKR
jgi:hypothetical protein